jgi:hypothetical protein
MAKKPEPAQPIRRDLYRAAAKATPLGTVEAADEDEAIDKAAKEFKVIATKLIAVRRCPSLPRRAVACAKRSWRDDQFFRHDRA